MSILRMASFKASYALFLKLVSGTIRTIAISASAMVCDALVSFRTGTTDLLRRRCLSSENFELIIGIPNARLSSCASFRHFHLVPCLDNFASGIPNAITSQLFGGRNHAAAKRGCVFAITAGNHGPEKPVPCRRTKKLTSRRKPMSNSKDAVRKILDLVKADKRTSLTAPEGKLVCDAYGIPVPKEGVAKSASAASKIATDIGFPVVMKIVSPDILHKTEAGGVMVGVKTAADVEKNYATILANAKKYKSDAKIEGIQIQQMLLGGQEVIVGAVTDGSFGKLVAFGLGGVLVEVLKDITFRLAPATKQDALSMLDGIQAHEMLKGVRGSDPANRDAIADIIVNVSTLISDFPEIAEMDLNPVFATRDGAIAADVRIVVNFSPAPARYRPTHEDIVRDMNRIMKPKAVAVIGASSEAGKIGNSVMKNLINGGYLGQIYPIHPKADEIMGKKAYKSVKDVPGEIDIAVFAIPANFVAAALAECGEKKIVGAILIPSGYAETGNIKGQEEIQAIGQKYGIRLMGPNIYGFYYTPANLCATFCTAYDVKGSAALSSQSGGIGMAIIGFSRSAKMGVSAIVGLGNKSDIDEDDLLAFFEQDPNTNLIAQHCEDLKD